MITSPGHNNYYDAGAQPLYLDKMLFSLDNNNCKYKNVFNVFSLDKNNYCKYSMYQLFCTIDGLLLICNTLLMGMLYFNGDLQLYEGSNDVL